MTAKATSLGLKAGFYINYYICNERMPPGGVNGPQYMRVMEGTVQFLKENNFQYLKIDSGSCYNDMTLWHSLIEKSGQPMTIENCHQGGQPPNASWCPFDLWRVSGDASVVGLDVEIMKMVDVLPLSRPGSQP